MSFLENLLGGGQQQRREYEDFANRYEQGPPWEGYDDDEVVNRYQQLAPNLSQQEYMQAAQQAYSRMSPQERVQFGQYLQQQARQRGYDDQAWDDDDNMYHDPGYLAQVTGRMEQQQPGILGQLFGGSDGSGGAGNVVSNPLAKAALAGVAAVAARNLMNRM